MALKFSGEANTKRSQIKKQLDDDLSAVAERLASHGRCERVLVTHVEQAFSALARVGMRRSWFFKRTEFEGIAGGVFTTLAAAAPSFVPLVAPNLQPTKTLLIAGVILAFGVGLMIHSWMRGMV
jgi:hypothetical protein